MQCSVNGKNIKHMRAAGVLTINLNTMREQFEATLTGTDGPVDGIVSPLSLKNYPQAYEFKSLDDTLHLVIAIDNKGKWQRIDGTEPYLSGWVDELAEQIAITE
jgi:hypothetical protein